MAGLLAHITIPSLSVSHILGRDKSQRASHSRTSPHHTFSSKHCVLHDTTATIGASCITQQQPAVATLAPTTATASYLPGQFIRIGS